MHVMQRMTDRLALVCLDVRIWSGRKKLRAEDLTLGTQVPPEDLVSLGSKRVCDPEALRVFHNTKKAAERACLAVGTRFLGGFAVPAERTAAVADALAVLKDTFDRETRTFLADYDRALDAWIASLPAWEEPIRRAIEPANVVGGRMRFGYRLLQVGPAERSGTFEEEVLGLGDGIFAEVGQMARELDASFEGKDRLNRRALGTFRRIREKLACLSFVDPRIQPVVDSLDDWLARLPGEGPIAGALFNEGMGLALLLGDAERMSRHGAGLWGIRAGEVPGEPDATPEPQDPAPVPTRGSEVSGPSFANLDAELDALFGTTAPPTFALRNPIVDPEPEPKPALEAESFFF